jgi:hypothetical protein
MNRKFLYLRVVVLFLLTLWALDDIAQYWNARTTVGTVVTIEQRKKQIGSNFVYWFETYPTVAWDEDGLERRVAMPYESKRSRRHAVAPPYVGMQIPIVYVKSKPHLARLALAHKGFRLLWIPLLLGWLFTWLKWHGKFPYGAYQPKSRRRNPFQKTNHGAAKRG